MEEYYASKTAQKILEKKRLEKEKKEKRKQELKKQEESEKAVFIFVSFFLVLWVFFILVWLVSPNFWVVFFERFFEL